MTSSLAGKAVASSRLVACAAVLPQHSQPGISARVRPSLAAVPTNELSSSLAVPCSEQPG